MSDTQFQSIVFRIARIALSDADLFDQIASDLNLSDIEMQDVRDQLIRLTPEA